MPTGAESSVKATRAAPNRNRYPEYELRQLVSFFPPQGSELVDGASAPIPPASVTMARTTWKSQRLSLRSGRVDEPVTAAFQR